jgi:hypothetical protein
MAPRTNRVIDRLSERQRREIQEDVGHLMAAMFCAGLIAGLLLAVFARII